MTLVECPIPTNAQECTMKWGFFNTLDNNSSVVLEPAFFFTSLIAPTVQFFPPISVLRSEKMHHDDRKSFLPGLRFRFFFITGVIFTCQMSKIAASVVTSTGITPRNRKTFMGVVLRISIFDLILINLRPSVELQF